MVFIFFAALLSSRPLLDLQMVSEKLCWNVLVLLGAGFAVAAACKVRFNCCQHTFYR